MYRIALILALALFAASCGGRRSRPQQTACVSQPRVFLPAIAPARLSPQEQRDYLRWHYWDRFDFADTLFVREADTAQMVEAYARWVARWIRSCAAPPPRARCSTTSRCSPNR